ncbi:MAG: hypothetical protein HOQ24_04680 [Mycobacteriaceae bacterium]|nr:hypothetical protein [Mycobacteriaceae bacterium]
MFDPISLIAGGALVGAGWVAGRFGRRTRAAAPQPSVARCGCGHDLAMHDRETRECHSEFKRKTNGVATWVRCPCRQYSGPQPLAEFFAPPLLPPQEP